MKCKSSIEVFLDPKLKKGIISVFAVFARFTIFAVVCLFRHFQMVMARQPCHCVHASSFRAAPQLPQLLDIIYQQTYKQKICTINLSFQNTKNMLSSIKIQGEKGKNSYLIP